MTHLRQAMLEELHRRNYAASTITYYVKNVEQFARYFRRSPDRLNQTHLRTTVVAHAAGQQVRYTRRT